MWLLPHAPWFIRQRSTRTGKLYVISLLVPSQIYVMLEVVPHFGDKRTKLFLGLNKLGRPNPRVSLSGGAPLHGITDGPLGASGLVKCHPWSMDGPTYLPLLCPQVSLLGDSCYRKACQTLATLATHDLWTDLLSILATFHWKFHTSNSILWILKCTETIVPAHLRFPNSLNCSSLPCFHFSVKLPSLGIHSEFLRA